MDGHRIDVNKNNYSGNMRMDINYYNKNTRDTVDPSRVSNFLHEDGVLEDELNPDRMEFDGIVETMQHSVIYEYLVKISKFLKCNKKCLRFPNITPYIESFLIKLALDPNNFKSAYFTRRCKILGEMILKLLEEGKDEYNMVCCYEYGRRHVRKFLTYRKISNDDSETNHTPVFKTPGCLLLEKVSKECSSDKNKDQNTPETAPATEAQIARRQLHVATRRAILEKVTPEFMDTTLQKILDFMHDEKTASLDFQGLTSDEAKFLKSLRGFITSTKLHDYKNLLTETSFDILMLCHSMISSGQWRKIYFIEEKLHKRPVDKLRHITIMKVGMEPIYYIVNSNTGRQSNENSISWIRESSLKSRPENDLSPGHKFLKAISASDSDGSQEVTCNFDGTRSRECSMDSEVSRARSISKEGRILKNVRFKCGGSLDVNMRNDGPIDSNRKQQGENVRGEWRRSRSRESPTARKTKLLEAMSVPLESDKAVRMMRLMGWEGGALGIRGEGITEPIMPALDIVSGAGLGHSRSVKEAREPRQLRETREPRDRSKRKQNTRTERMELLNNILEFLQSEYTEKYIEYKKVLPNKLKKFIMTTVMALNQRKNSGVCREEEVVLMETLMAEMLFMSNMAIMADIGEDERLLILTKKVMDPGVKIDHVRNVDTPAILHVPDELPGDLITHTDVLDFSKTIVRSRMSNKSLEALSYNLIFLLKILDFVKSERMEVEIRLDKVLCFRQCKFIETAVSCINRREKHGLSSKLENDLLKEIKFAIDGCFLNVKFENTYQKFSLHKQYYKKRYKNFAKEIAELFEATNINNTANNNDNESLNGSTTSESPIRPANISDNDGSIFDSDNPISIRSTSTNNVQETINTIQIGNTNISVLELTDKSVACEKVLNWAAETEILENDMINLEKSILNNCEQSEQSGTDIKKEPLNNEIQENRTEFSPSIKRSRNDSERSNPQTMKKTRFKYSILANIRMIPKNYPHHITVEDVKTVQKLISERLHTDYLPLLKCHGIKNSALVYGCHDEESMKFMESVASAANLIIECADDVSEVSKRHKMAFKINCFIEYSVRNILSKFELYNTGLSTKHWLVINEKVSNDLIIVNLEIDDESFKYISEVNFSLYAGIDKAQFTLVWD